MLLTWRTCLLEFALVNQNMFHSALRQRESEWKRKKSSNILCLSLGITQILFRELTPIFTELVHVLFSFFSFVCVFVVFRRAQRRTQKKPAKMFAVWAFVNVTFNYIINVYFFSLRSTFVTFIIMVSNYWEFYTFHHLCCDTHMSSFMNNYIERNSLIAQS